MLKLLRFHCTIFLLCFSTMASAQTIHYVKQNGTGDGSSWAAASGDLQLVINNSVAGDQVWVAGGTYYPMRKADNLNAVSPDDRDNAFVLKKDIKIYGGFAGVDETAVTQRDSIGMNNPSILSGDLGIVGDRTDNAYHVVISAGDAGAAELNGFSITDGNADANPFVSDQFITIYSQKIYQTAGGAMNISSSSPALNNLMVTDCYADAGGGIYISSSSPVFNNVSSLANNASYGGGMYITRSSAPVLHDVIIRGNNATSNGGGIQNNDSSPILTNVTISGNNANSSNGGGIYNGGSSPILTNVIISGNAGYRGGGIFNYQSSPILTNVTISGNNASGSGGGMFNSTDTYPEIRNSIIYGNSDGIGKVAASVSIVAYSLVEGLSPFSFNPKIIRINIINGAVDPEFISMPSFETAPFTGGNYRLQTESPVIGMASETYFSSDSIPDLSSISGDIDGSPRDMQAISMGAYEHFSPLPVTLINFTAQKEGRRTKLSWTTSSEVNNKKFIISRSADGNSFDEIGVKAAMGNSPSENYYIFYDENPMSRNNFYKLAHADYDGNVKVLGIKKVMFVSEDKITLYPNPVKELLQLEFSPGIYQGLELTDVNGQTLKQIPVAKTETRKSVDMGNLTPGTYFIRLTGNAITQTRRVVKK